MTALSQYFAVDLKRKQSDRSTCQQAFWTLDRHPGRASYCPGADCQSGVVVSNQLGRFCNLSIAGANSSPFQAYDRWWQGRTLWSQTGHSLRLIGQTIWLLTPLQIARDGEASLPDKRRALLEKKVSYK